MKPLPIILILMQGVASIAGSDNARVSGTEITNWNNGLKCGRDSVFCVLCFLSKDSSLDEVDAILNRKPISSIWEIEQCLQRFGLHTSSLEFTTEHLSLLGRKLARNQRVVSAIALLPNNAGSSVGHFVRIADIDGNELRFEDGASFGAISIDQIGKTLKVILVSRNKERLDFSLSQRFFDMSRWAIEWYWPVLILIGCCAVTFATSVRWAVTKTLQAAMCCFAIQARVWLFTSGLLVCIGAIVVVVSKVFKNEAQLVTCVVPHFDAGNVSIGERVTASFVLCNRTSSKEYRALLRASCTCISLNTQRVTIHPGEAFTVVASFQVERQGEHNYSIAVVSQLQSETPKILTISCSGQAATRLVPYHYSIGDVPVGREWERTMEFSLVSTHSHAPAIKELEVGSVASAPVVKPYLIKQNDDVVTVKLVANRTIKTIGSFEEPLRGNTMAGEVLVARISGNSVPPVTVFPTSVLAIRSYNEGFRSQFSVRSPFSEVRDVILRKQDERVEGGEAFVKELHRHEDGFGFDIVLWTVDADFCLNLLLETDHGIEEASVQLIAFK